MSRNKGGGGHGGGGEAAAGAGAPAVDPHAISGEGLFDSIASYLTGEALADAARSGFQPTLRRKAELLAKPFKARLPVDHLARSDWAEATIDFVGTVIRRLGKGGKTFAGIGLEEAGEFTKMFGEELCKEENGETRGRAAKLDKEFREANPETAKALDKANADLVTEAVRLFNLTPADRRKEMSAAMNERAAMNFEFEDVLFNGPKPAPEKKVPGVPFKKHVADGAKAVGEAVDAALKPINAEAGKLVARLEASNTALEASIRAKGRPSRSPAERFIRWLSK